MSILESRCNLTAEQARTLVEVSYAALSKEELAYFTKRPYGSSAQKAFYTRFLWKLIENLDMSVIDLE